MEYNVVEFVQEEASSEECLEETKIVYLKTHKCASSSLQNIFLRFGEKRNLNFVLPKGRVHWEKSNRVHEGQISKIRISLIIFFSH